MRSRYSSLLYCIALVALSLAGSNALAQAPADPVRLDVVGGGHGKVRLTITAGPGGAPSGFQVCWMPRSLFEQNGSRWTWPWIPGEGWVNYTGIGTLNTWGSTEVDFRLLPNQSIDIELGDTRGESGVNGVVGDELEPNTDYVFVALAHGSGMGAQSPLSATVSSVTSTQGQNCTYTLGYWKNHTAAWPVSSLKLGTVTYSASQLLSILKKSVSGNGLVSLAHQLIATKLNIANGANPTTIASTVLAADALIGGLVAPPVGSGYLPPSASSSLTQALDDFNNGVLGPAHCGSTPTQASSWGKIKASAR